MGKNWLQHSMEGNDATLGTLRRGSVQKVDDSGDQQLVDLQGLKNDSPMKVVRILPHGFSSNPPLQAEGILKSLGGRSDRLMFIGGEHPQYRQKNLATGAAVLYDQNGNVIYANMQNGIQISTKTGHITVTPAQGQMLFLGGDGQSGTYDFVAGCSGQCSTNVKVKIS
jgi:phage gp45-like